MTYWFRGPLPSSRSKQSWLAQIHVGFSAWGCRARGSVRLDLMACPGDDKMGCRDWGLALSIRIMEYVVDGLVISTKSSVVNWRRHQSSDTEGSLLSSAIYHCERFAKRLGVHQRLNPPALSPIQYIVRLSFGGPTGQVFLFASNCKSTRPQSFRPNHIKSTRTPLTLNLPLYFSIVHKINSDSAPEFFLSAIFRIDNLEYPDNAGCQQSAWGLV